MCGFSFQCVCCYISFSLSVIFVEIMVHTTFYRRRINEKPLIFELSCFRYNRICMDIRIAKAKIKQTQNKKKKHKQWRRRSDQKKEKDTDTHTMPQSEWMSTAKTKKKTTEHTTMVLVCCWNGSLSMKCNFFFIFRSFVLYKFEGVRVNLFILVCGKPLE